MEEDRAEITVEEEVAVEDTEGPLGVDMGEEEEEEEEVMVEEVEEEVEEDMEEAEGEGEAMAVEDSVVEEEEEIWDQPEVVYGISIGRERR